MKKPSFITRLHAHITSDRIGGHKWFSMWTALAVAEKPISKEETKKMESVLQIWVSREVLEKRKQFGARTCTTFYRFIKDPALAKPEE